MTKEIAKKMYRHYAAIDVGSNAVRLLIKRFEKNGSDIYSTKEQLVRVPLRLGFEVFRKNKISKDKEKDLTRLIRSFTYIMKIYDVAEYMACATSALRDAKNGKDVVKRIKDKTGIRIQILNGQEEAKEIRYGHSPADKGNCMYVDVGGGSTEITIVSDGDLVYSRSFNIGTVRMLCEAVSDREWKSMEDDLHELMGMYTNVKIIGSGGNINKIYRLIENRDRQQKSIMVSSLTELYNDLINLTIDERVRIYGLRYDRADVIVPAAEIFIKIADILKSKKIYVPTIGLSDAMINTLFEHRLKKYGSKLTDDESDASSETHKENEDDEESHNGNDNTLNDNETLENSEKVSTESMTMKTQNEGSGESAESSK